jgi:hypothetical protein
MPSLVSTEKMIGRLNWKKKRRKQTANMEKNKEGECDDEGRWDGGKRGVLQLKMR